MKNRSRLLTVLLYIVVFAVAVVLISEVFFRDDTVYVNYSTVCEQFRSENVRSFDYDNGVLTLELRKPYQNEAYSVSHKLADLGLFYEDLGTLIAEQQESGVLQSYNYVPMRQTPWYVRMLPEMLLSVIMIALVYMVLVRNSGGMMKFGHANARVGSGRDKVMFSDVAGADEEKAELQEIVDFLRDPAKYRRIGARIPKGVLLVGPPGTGKTLLARAVAGEAGVQFLSISGSDFVELYVGVGASRVRDLFDQAKKVAPAIVFIDEIDAVGRQRGSGLGGGHDEREQTLNQLLVEMDGFTNNEGVIVMAATNRADILDNALLRPGRFDRRVYMGLPDIKGREEILKVHARGKPLGDDVDLKSIARGTAGFAGADLENLLNEAAIMATRSKRRFIMQADIDEAILKVVMGPEKKSRVVSERARRLTAYHESGHAIASFFLKNSDPVHYITIIPRGAAGGFTWYRKAEDAENFTSRGEMFDSIVSALGGRIAEQLFLDDISTGASNDIQQATNIARDMVMKYGMSEKLGPISFDDSSHSIFIGRDFGTTKSYSEETAATIDEEVKHLFDQAYAKCEALLREHADLLTGLAEYLLIHETIEGDDFRYYCEHGVMPVHPDDTIEPPAKVIRRMDEAPETPQPDAEAPAQPEAPSAPDADAPNSDPGEQP